ncbi:hypothetical protein HELRODRAFT_178609 [Helobdella robusta]|uniref:Uncharacterized protein n=1 Tax=Helobdella robusta TaxID=6412 RepID=T1FDG2_HELRO|nr:hypothetical protein HELRODRAFT_178609 [Helobdella robusta]ESN96814.1 hypothetical protein HELRODRAFT_178609 [Helobdella robusta]
MPNLHKAEELKFCILKVFGYGRKCGHGFNSLRSWTVDIRSSVALSQTSKLEEQQQPPVSLFELHRNNIPEGLHRNNILEELHKSNIPEDLHRNNIAEKLHRNNNPENLHRNNIPDPDRNNIPEDLHRNNIAEKLHRNNTF